jgi:hypothetical protein
MKIALIKTLRLPLIVVLSFTFLSLLVGFNVGEEIELENALNARSSANFLKKRKNIRTTLSKGTTGKVLKIKKFKSGNSGIKIKVSSGPKKGQSYWVYFNVKNPSLKLIDEKNEIVNPDKVSSALENKSTARAKRDISAIKDNENSEDTETYSNPSEASGTSKNNESLKDAVELSIKTLSSKIDPSLKINDCNNNLVVSSPSPLNKVFSSCKEYSKNDLPSEADSAYQRALSSEEQKTGKQNSSLEIEGIKLSGTQSEMDGFKKILGEKPPTNWTTTVQGCTSVLCALSKLYSSEESAKRALTVYFYSGYAISLDQTHNTGPERFFSTDDIRDIDLSLRLLPKNFYKLPTFRGFVTAASKVGAAASAILGTENKPGDILFRGNSNYVVFLHEFGHQVDNSQNFSDHNDFLNSCWVQGHQKFIDENGSAKINQKEAFAEIFKYYILWPQILKQKNIECYNHFKNNIFNEKEFPTTNANCSPINQFPELSF